MPAFWNLLGSAKKCAARSMSPRSSAASQRRMMRVAVLLAGPVERSGTFAGIFRSSGSVCVAAPLSGVVSRRSTPAPSPPLDPPQPAAPATANASSKASTQRRAPDMPRIIPRPEGPKGGNPDRPRRTPRARGRPLGPTAVPRVLRRGTGAGPTVGSMPTDTRLWHPFADMHAVRGAEIVMVRGEGAYVWDDDGRRYLDGTASLWNVNVGHGRERDRRRRRRADDARSRATRRSARSPTRPRCGSPSASPSSRRSTTPGSSSAPAAVTRSTPPASSPAATSPPPGRPSASTSSAARRATTAPTASARASAASPPTASTWGRSTRTPRSSRTTRSRPSRPRSSASAPTGSRRCSSSR